MARKHWWFSLKLESMATPLFEDKLFTCVLIRKLLFWPTNETSETSTPWMEAIEKALIDSLLEKFMTQRKKQF